MSPRSHLPGPVDSGYTGRHRRHTEIPRLHIAPSPVVAQPLSAQPTSSTYSSHPPSHRGKHRRRSGHSSGSFRRKNKGHTRPIAPVIPNHRLSHKDRRYRPQYPVLNLQPESAAVEEAAYEELLDFFELHSCGDSSSDTTDNEESYKPPDIYGTDPSVSSNTDSATRQSPTKMSQDDFTPRPTTEHRRIDNQLNAAFDEFGL